MEDVRRQFSGMIHPFDLWSPLSSCKGRWRLLVVQKSASPIGQMPTWACNGDHQLCRLCLKENGTQWYISIGIHLIFVFWFFVTFCDEIGKTWKYYVIFVYILQGKMGKMDKNGKKIMQLKWPNYQKPKDESMGWTKHYRSN